MKQHKKKIIAPIIISVILILYYILYFTLILESFENMLGFKIAFGIFPILFSLVTIKVCIERINEIKKGEEDDISKYWFYQR